MRVDCPACAASYDIPDRLLVSGRKARCARCGHDWVPVTEPPADALALAADPEPPEPEALPQDGPAPQMVMPPAVTAMDRLKMTAPPPPNPLHLRLGWVASISAMAALVACVLVWRDPIMRAWPPSTRLLGLWGTPAHGAAHGSADAPRMEAAKPAH